MHAMHALLRVEKALMVAARKLLHARITVLHVLVRKSAAANTTLRERVMVLTRVCAVADHQASKASAVLAVCSLTAAQ